MSKIEVDIGPKLSKHSSKIMTAVWIIIAIAVIVVIFSLFMMFNIFQKLPF
ncbi:hypothetical protein HN695_06605 [Candidatus Woesearchaeota archaeon]|jgi:hypothetical protein|nr:hypothetical protein [Candidatus Woesearchaeota archaeon]MBT5271833.1 hypothetical protein [Candidatus Woesearchaeota archaeon]MBT6040731.1 hypothetical protein [Candidatus Woesearchaeota archaeon]MBT6337452.1 hypothetical protein [Candidatus Woesearchaeota archaeon]MBT7927978.1 hypothetical protein [Candidatus Woesearchaeota archaeon]